MTVIITSKSAGSVLPFVQRHEVFWAWANSARSILGSLAEPAILLAGSAQFPVSCLTGTL